MNRGMKKWYEGTKDQEAGVEVRRYRVWQAEEGEEVDAMEEGGGGRGMGGKEAVW